MPAGSKPIHRRLPESAFVRTRRYVAFVRVDRVGATNGRTLVGPRRGVRWFLAGYAGVTGFLALETVVRQPGSASDLRTSKDDAASTRGLVVAYALALLSAPLLRRLPFRPLPRLCGPLGLGVLLAGLVLRAWSMQTLSDAYTRTLRVTNQQTVTERGPYRHVRHPGYLGSLLIWCGFALASGSAVIVGTVAALLVPAYLHRIDAEEELLDRDLPGYPEYRARTKRLLPHVW
jgi:protein-S-isoprenylcysteine O-methyltransferase